MAAISGKSGAVTVGGNEVNGIKSWTIDYTIDPLDTTDFQSDGIREVIAGKSQWSGSFEGDKDGAPIAVGGIVALVLKESDTANQLWSGNALIAGISSAAANDSTVTYSYTFEGTGALTPASA